MGDSKSILSIRIKELRTELGLTQEELALKLGLKGKSSIANYESDKITPSDDIKLKMCELFNCSMDYLMGKSNYKNSSEQANYNGKSMGLLYMLQSINNDSSSLKIIDDIVNELIDNTDILKKDPIAFINQRLFLFPDSFISTLSSLILNLYYDFIENKNEYWRRYHSSKFSCLNFMDFCQFRYEDDEDDINEIQNLLKVCEDSIDYIVSNECQLYMCPVYGQISAGQPNWAEECIEGRLPIDYELMNIANPEEHFFLRVNGESMNKIVKNGAYALIHKQDTVENGEIAVVLVNGYDATLKKITQNGNVVVLEPMSEDSSFQTQIYNENTDIKILGKYIGKFEMNK